VCHLHVCRSSDDASEQRNCLIVLPNPEQLHSGDMLIKKVERIEFEPSLHMPSRFARTPKQVKSSAW
jgi:hypothetical protein